MCSVLEKAVTDKVSSLMDMLSSEHVEHANFCDDLKEITTFFEWTKRNICKSLSTVVVRVQQNYDDVVDAVNRKTHEDLVDGRNKTRPPFYI